MNDSLSNKIPYSAEAENFVLGAMMIDTRLANEYCGRLVEDHFFIDNNKLVFRAINNLRILNQSTDAVKVYEEIKRLNLQEKIDTNYLYELVESIPTIVNAETYVEVLEEKELERSLYYEAQQISKRVLDGNLEIQELLAKTEAEMGDIFNRQRTTPLKAVNLATEGVLSLIEKNRNRAEGDLIGLDTGFKEINEYTFGFQNGELTILAARPGIGKSALALNMASAMCKGGHHVAFFSLEMGIDQLLMRQFAAHSGINLKKIKTGDLTESDTAKLLVAKQMIDKYNLYFSDLTIDNLEDLKVTCRKYKREEKLDFIVVDYLQLLTLDKRSKGMSLYENTSRISRGLKLLARELNVPILALSQLSREVEKRNSSNQEGVNKKPMLSDLRESGSIEQDADVVMFLHREDTKGDNERIRNRKTELIIAKNRQGMTGSCVLSFRGDCSLFVPFKKESEEE